MEEQNTKIKCVVLEPLYDRVGNNHWKSEDIIELDSITADTLSRLDIVAYVEIIEQPKQTSKAKRAKAEREVDGDSNSDNTIN